jgi:hypothetical protein
MIKKYLCSLVIILIACQAPAQKKNATFHSLNSVGIALGENENNGLVQSVNGIKYNSWFAGIGIGADFYFHRTIPLFIDLQKHVGNGNNIILYADAGYNFPWNDKPSNKEVPYYTSYQFTGGIYTDIGIGYKISGSKKPSFVISTGYSYKKLHSKISVVNPCITPPCPEEVSNYDLGYGRIVFKAGIGLR